MFLNEHRQCKNMLNRISASRYIVELLQKDDDDFNDEDIAHMKKVRSYERLLNRMGLVIRHATCWNRLKMFGLHWCRSGRTAVAT